MHHPPLYWPRPHNGHLNHQIIKTTRLQPRQHRHLRPRLHLKYPDGIRAAQHVIHRRIFRRHRMKLQIPLAPPLFVPLIHQINRLSNAREHPQPQHIHLQHPHRINVILIPFNNQSAFGHGRIFNRNNFNTTSC